MTGATAADDLSAHRQADIDNAPLDSTIATRISIGFHVSEAAARRRLPAPWRPVTEGGDPADVQNLTMIFSDVLLNLDPHGARAPAVAARNLIFLIPALHPDSGERIGFVFRIFTSHAEDVPGKYGNSLQSSLKREQRTESVGLETRVSELIDLRSPDGGRIELRLRYLRGEHERIQRESKLRSTNDPEVRRTYRSDELSDALLDKTGGIDRLQYFEFRSTVGELSDLFDGSERIVTVRVAPWYLRDVYPG